MQMSKFDSPEEINVLIGCERSGVVRDEFVRLGFNAFSCDLNPLEGGNDNRHIQDDIRVVAEYGEWDLLCVMHPPCTRLCNSGVRWLHRPPKGRTLDEMWQELHDGAELFSFCWNVRNIQSICIENPVMHKHAKRLIQNYAPANQHVQPHQFGDPYFKSTGLYLRNLPELVPTNQLDVPDKETDLAEYNAWSAVHRASGANRSEIRSRTFPGVAKAVAKQFGSHLLKSGYNYSLAV